MLHEDSERAVYAGGGGARTRCDSCAGMSESVGIVDLGSGSVTLGVYRRVDDGLVRVGESSEPLRLQRALSAGRFSAATMATIVSTVERFRSVAATMGCQALDVVATSAVREAGNRTELAAALARKGFALTILDGEQEASAAVLGVVSTLPVVDGTVVDQGGGSLQIARVTGRKMRKAVTLPLGAVRLADQHLPGDGVPSHRAVTGLRRAVESAIAPHREASGGTVVGVGGSVRALAKIDRKVRGWPLAGSHGYALSRDALFALAEWTTRVDRAAREAIPGLSSHRAEAIGAAAVTWATLVERWGTEDVLVSSSGLREGRAFRALWPATVAFDVRRAGLVARFGRVVERDDVLASALATAAAAGVDAAGASALRVSGFTQVEWMRVVDALRRSPWESALREAAGLG